MKRSTSTRNFPERQVIPLKIGLVLDDSLDRNDGVQQYVRSLGEWLNSQGHRVHYLTGQTRAVGDTVHSLSRNIRMRFNGNRLTIPLPAPTKAIKALLNAEKYDILHVQMPYSPVMAGKIIAQASQATAVVGTFHILPLGRWQRYGSRALGIAQKRQLRRFDAVCSVSPAAQSFAHSHFGLNSDVIPNMINVSAWRSAAIRPHPKRIVFLGRLVARKGCYELLQTLNQLREIMDISEVEVLIAGSGPEEKRLKAFCKKMGLAQVKFLGYVPESDKAALLASAELAVFPSIGGESFGIVLLEAMAAGAGVVLGGNNPGYTSVLGMWPDTLFNPSYPQEFAQTLQKFLIDRSLRARIHSAQQQAVKQYDTQVVGSLILGLYNQAIAKRRKAKDNKYHE